MSPDDRRHRFEALTAAHLDAAFNLARWLTRDDHDAADVVQEAFVRAHRYLDGLRGEDARPWLLRIVRHTCFSWMQANRPAGLVSFEDGVHDVAGPESAEPPAHAMRNAERARLNEALAGLPFAFREVLVLREFEDLAYKDIARIVDVPIGTVMSRLSRARGLLREALLAAPRPVLRTVPGSRRGAGS